jgi:hypothetical protein
MAAVEGAGQELASSTEALAAAEKAADAELADLRAEHQAAVAAVAVLQQEQTARQEYVASLEQELQFLNKVPTLCLHLFAPGGCCWMLKLLVRHDNSKHAPPLRLPSIDSALKLSLAVPGAARPDGWLPVRCLCRSWRSGSGRWRSMGTA